MENVTPGTTEQSTEATVVSDNGETQSETTYLDGKYKSVSDLENGYKELQSTFSKKTAEYKDGLKAFSGAPEAYELAEGVESTERIEALQEWGKENGLNNDALNQIIELDTNHTNQQQEAYVAEQKELLGKDADTRIQNVVDWAKANLGEDSIGALDKMVTSAEGVMMFEAIAKMQSGTAPAPARQTQAVDADTIRQMRFAKDEYGNRRMSSDPAYRAKVIELESQLSQS